MKIPQIALLFLCLSACSSLSPRKQAITRTLLIPSSPVPTTTPTSFRTKTFIPATLTVPSFDETCETTARTIGLGVSPDGNWTAVTCQQKADTDNISSYLHVFNTHDKRDWRVNYADYAGNFFVDRHDVFYPFHWSDDGQSLYIVHPTRLSGTIGLGPGGEFLVKIDLPTGQTQEVINGMGRYPQISFSFSQGDEFLLYIPQGTNSYKVNILDLTTQKTREIKLQEDNLYGAGFAKWSNDNKKVLLLLQDEHLQYSLVLLNLVDLFQTTLVKDMESPLHPIKWTDENMVLLSTNYPNASTGHEQWLLDTRSGEMINLEHKTTPEP